MDKSSLNSHLKSERKRLASKVGIVGIEDLNTDNLCKTLLEHGRNAIESHPDDIDIKILSIYICGSFYHNEAINTFSQSPTAKAVGILLLPL